MSCAQTFYRDWAFSDERIVGFDPYPLQGCGRFSGKCPEVMARTSMALGLLDMPEILAEYQALGRAIVQQQKKGP